MKELRIADCLHVTDKILTKVASCCPDLEVLIFYNKYNKSDGNDTLDGVLVSFEVCVLLSFRTNFLPVWGVEVLEAVDVDNQLVMNEN